MHLRRLIKYLSFNDETGGDIRISWRRDYVIWHGSCVRNIRIHKRDECSYLW